MEFLGREKTSSESEAGHSPNDVAPGSISGSCDDAVDSARTASPLYTQPDLSTEQAPIYKGSTLKRNFSWTFLGNTVYSTCQWAMLVILAKLGTPHMVGRFALGLAVTAPIILFASFQLRTVQATDAKREYSFGDYLGLRLMALGPALVIIAAIAFATYRLETALVVLSVGIAKTFESISDVFFGLLQQHERMDRIAKSLIIKGTLSLLVLGTAVYITRSVLWGSVGLAVAWALTLFTYDTRSGKMILGAAKLRPGNELLNMSIKPRWDPHTLLKLAKMAFPLGVAVCLGSLRANIPRYTIEHYLGERELGVFAAIAYLMVAATTVAGALAESVAPRFGKYHAAGNVSGFKTTLMKVMAFGATLGIVGLLLSIFAGRQILSIIYTPEYAQRSDILVMTMIATGISCTATFFNYAMTAARYIVVQMYLFILVTGLTALTSYWLVPIYGLSGAAMSLIIASAVHFFGSLFLTWHAIRALRLSVE